MPTKPAKKKRLRLPNGKLERKHPQYGTSKLEQDFAEQFLDKLGVKYIYQYEATSIGRYYDFAVFTPNCDGNVNCMILIEIDGGYYHADPRLVDEDKMSPMQKRNKRIDEIKNKWALTNGIPIIRIWEKDIREKPSDVMKMLKARFYIEEGINADRAKKNKRHVNKMSKKRMNG